MRLVAVVLLGLAALASARLLVESDTSCACMKFSADDRQFPCDDSVESPFYSEWTELGQTGFNMRTTATLDQNTFAAKTLGVQFSSADLDALDAQREQLPPILNTWLDWPVQARTASVLNGVGFDWNPNGHPPAIYEVPHMDVHFHLSESGAAVAKLTNEEPPANPGRLAHMSAVDLPADYNIDGGNGVLNLEAVPMMGRHHLSFSAPELNGAPFGQTIILGSWNGHVNFIEPMIAKSFLDQVKNSETKRVCADVFNLPKVEETGYYPTRYCSCYTPENDLFTVSLENFVYRVGEPFDLFSQCGPEQNQN